MKKKLAVDFAIHSTESKQEFSTVGTWENNTISFVDPANETNIIELLSDSVHYKKTGQSDLDFRFEKDNTHKGHYQVMNHVFEFEVKTKVLHIKDNELHVEYELYQNGDAVNRTSLTLQYAFIEEE